MDSTPDSSRPEAFDAYATLGLERSLVLDGSLLESAWRELSKAHHPDQSTGDTERSATLNRAHETLRSPSARLRHWLELRDVEIGRQAAIEPALMDLFSEIGPLLQDADEILRKRQSTSSSLARALLAESEMAIQRRLQSLLGRLQGELTSTQDRFPPLETAVDSGNASEAIATLARLGFLEKWQRQVQERLMNLIAG